MGAYFFNDIDTEYEAYYKDNESDYFIIRNKQKNICDTLHGVVSDIKELGFHYHIPSLFCSNGDKYGLTFDDNVDKKNNMDGSYCKKETMASQFKKYIDNNRLFLQWLDILDLIDKKYHQSLWYEEAREKFNELNISNGVK
jgi:hypothetical protein